MPLGRAKMTRRGVYLAPSNIAMITKVALTRMVEDARSGLRGRMRAAYDIGGHHAHGGAPWKRLAPSTIRRKAKEGWARPAAPLVRSGAMRRNQMVLVNLKVIGRRAVQYSITTWNNKMYSKLHQTGYLNRLTGTWVPARPPSVITLKDMKYVESIIRRHLPRRLKTRFRYRFR